MRFVVRISLKFPQQRADKRIVTHHSTPCEFSEGGKVLVSGMSESLIDVALYAMASKEAEVQQAANIKILKTAMETEKAIVDDLLESMGIGEYIDVYA